MKTWFSALFSLWPAMLGAHPHVFIDVGFEFVFDNRNQLTHVRVIWAYDEFYSLLVLEDMNLDPDSDGVLTEEETARLTGFDMQWMPGFNGDLEILVGDRPVTLSGPKEATATVENGRIVTTHLRDVSGHVAGTYSAKAYDESYYTAYEVNRPVTVSGADGCFIEAIPADVDGQLEQMRAMLLRFDANADLEENDIPLIGAEFATEVRVSCPAS